MQTLIVISDISICQYFFLSFLLLKELRTDKD